jgi:hypothetical protein
MAQANATFDLPVTADRIWALIGGFGSLPDWLPYIPRSELSEGGRVRRLAGRDGATIVERLITFDHSGRSYSYAILQSPFPVTDYLSTLRVEESDDGNGSRVEWSGRFTPNGVSEDEVSSLFRSIYEDGLKALADKLGLGR